MAEQTTTSQIPVIGTFEQIKAGLGFGPKRAESKLDATVDGIAGLINTIAAPQGKQLNRASEEFAQLVEAIEDGARGDALAQLIIATAAVQGIQITLDQLLRDPAPQTFLTAAQGIPPGAVTVDAAGNVILDPRVAPILGRPVVPSPTIGARGLGFTAPSGFPILPPRRSPTPARGGGFDFARFIQCLLGSFSPSPAGGTATMPFVTTAGPQASAGGFDFGGFLGGALDIARNIFSAPQAPAQRFPELQTAAFPLLGVGGALTKARTLLPAVGAGFAGSALEEFFLGSGGASTQDQAAAFTDPVPGSCRPKAHVKTNPCTGKGVWFVPRGRPLVFSGDMSACKRVDRVAKRLDKARPKRRHHHHAKRRPR